MSPLKLESRGLRAVIEPGCGGELRSLCSVPTGRELLFQPPWPRADVDRAAGEEEWTRGWRGGWQVLFPNAGDACTHNGREHPFHGDASLGNFDVVESAGDSATLRWVDPAEVSLERRVELSGSSITIETTLRNEGGEPFDFLFVEHLILGGDLVEPGARVELAGRWPLAGSEDWSVVPERGSRFWALADCEPWARASTPPGDLCAELRWDPGILSTLWFWTEANCLTDEPWNGRVRCLGLEPSSVSAADGLAARAAAREANGLAPGAAARAWIELTVQDAA